MSHDPTQPAVGFDVRNLTDAEAIGMVGKFQSREARGLWMTALLYTHGDQAVSFARGLLQPGVENQGNVVCSALTVLAKRAPAVAIQDASRLLGERRGFEVHLVALNLLMRSPRPEDIDLIYAYIGRRVSRRRSMMAGGDWEIPGYIRFAAETNTLPRIAALLERKWTNLHDREQARVNAAWPLRARRATAAGDVMEPHRGQLLEWELETNGDAESTDQQRKGWMEADLDYLNEWLAASWARHGPR